MREKIVAIIAEYLDIPPGDLDEAATLTDLRIDSLDFVEILFEIEEAFDVELMFDVQARKNDLRGLGDVLDVIEEVIIARRAAGAIDHAG